ncbi:MAG TPA: hypothetical protein VFK27_05205, partial [Bacillales bacterium]|nr:hypothetical protein [Bacillales bacterium]
PSGEKVSIPVRYRLDRFGFYDPSVHFTVKPDGAKEWSYDKKVTAAFKGIGAKFSGESDDWWHICNGRYHVLLGKHGGNIVPGSRKESEDKTFWFAPKLGKPFSDEFSRIRPESIDFFEEQGAIIMKANYISNAFKNLGLSTYAKLHAEGLIEHWYEVKNLSDDKESPEIWLNDSIFHNLNRPVMPYDNEILAVEDPVDYYHEYWEGSKVTGNWLFSRHGGGENRGVSWNDEDEVRFEEWFLYFEHNIGKLPASGSVRTNSTFVSIGAFADWRDFKAFAEQTSLVESPSVSGDVQFFINNGNPIVSEQKTKAEWKEIKSTYLNGKIRVSEDGLTVAEQSVNVKEQRKKAEFDLSMTESGGIHLFEAKAALQTQDVKRS